MPRIGVLLLLCVVLVGCEDGSNQCLDSESGNSEVSDGANLNFRSLRGLERPIVQVAADAFHRSSLKVHMHAEMSALADFESQSAVALVDEVCLIQKLKNNEPISALLEKVEVDPNSLHLSKSRVNSHTIRISHTQSLQALEVEAQSEACLKGIGDDVLFTLSSYKKDPLEGQQRHLNGIQASKAWETLALFDGGVSKDVIVAVIDSGIELTHEDLKEQLWVNLAERDGEPGVDDDENGYVDDVHGYNFAQGKGDPSHSGVWFGVEHGSHVSGLIGATGGNGKGVAGVMPQRVKIMALNVFGNRSGASTRNIDRAIRYAVDNGADVINMSLGGPGRAETTGSALAYAVSRGVSVAVAAGNSNLDIDRRAYTPAVFGAEYEGVVTVGATYAEDGKRCEFSNYGLSAVEVGAPGCQRSAPKSRNPYEGILSTVNDNGYDKMAGTSMASPVLAGGLALVVGVLKSKGISVESKITESSVKGTSDKLDFLEGKVAGSLHLNISGLADLLVALEGPKDGGGVVEPPDDEPDDGEDPGGEDPPPIDQCLALVD